MLTWAKPLLIICNNAFNNTVMIEQLKNNLLDFGKVETHTWCLQHMTNPVVKMLIKICDAKPMKYGGEEAVMVDSEYLSAEEAWLVDKLEELSKDIENEDQVVILE